MTSSKSAHSRTALMLLSIASSLGVAAGCASQSGVGSSESADTASAVTMTACPSDGSDANCPTGSQTARDEVPRGVIRSRREWHSL
jgi:hypothetical protein